MDAGSIYRYSGRCRGAGEAGPQRQHIPQSRPHSRTDSVHRLCDYPRADPLDPPAPRSGVLQLVGNADAGLAQPEAATGAIAFMIPWDGIMVGFARPQTYCAWGCFRIFGEAAPTGAAPRDTGSLPIGPWRSATRQPSPLTPSSPPSVPASLPPLPASKTSGSSPSPSSGIRRRTRHSAGSCCGRSGRGRRRGRRRR